jgi:hypothetical protein
MAVNQRGQWQREGGSSEKVVGHDGGGHGGDVAGDGNNDCADDSDTARCAC